MPTTVDAARPGFSTTVADLRLRTWLLGPGQPVDVIDLFTDADFKVVVDDRADVPFNFRDGRLYLGWFPDGRPGTDGEGRKLAVTGTRMRPATGSPSVRRPRQPLSPPPSAACRPRPYPLLPADQGSRTVL